MARSNSRSNPRHVHVLAAQHSKSTTRPSLRSPAPELRPSSPLPPSPRQPPPSGGADDQQPRRTQGRRERGSGRVGTARRSPGCFRGRRPSRLTSLRCRHVAPQESPPPSAPRRLHATLPHPPPRVLPPPPTSTSTTLPAPFSLEDYLVAACGLVPTQAREVSKKAVHQLSIEYRKEEVSSFRLSSTSNPDAILALLSSAGLSRADIAAVVSADPLILHTSVKKLAPRLLALRNRVGLSTPQITRFLLVASRAFRSCDVAPRLEFFISFYGSFDRALVAAKRNWCLLSASLERMIKPNIALFRQHGVTDVAKALRIQLVRAHS